MAGTREIRCVGPSAALEDRKSAIQRAINLYMSAAEGLGEDPPVILKSAPGLTMLIGADTFYGLFTVGDRIFFVLSDTLYELSFTSTSVYSYTALGSVAGTGWASMAAGQGQIVIVRGANGYVLNTDTNVVSLITDADWRGSDHVEFLDGYFIFVDPGTEQFYISAIDDGSDFDALDFSSADTQPDSIVAFRVHKRELILFGEYSSEVWINSGQPDFPLTRSNATPIEVGCVGKRAIAKTSDTVAWVGQSRYGRGIVYALQGYQPARISTKAVEEALAGSSDLASTVMWTYQTVGSEFIGITAPGLETTWVYDFATKQWHERAELVNNAYYQMRIDAMAYAKGQHFCVYTSESGRGGVTGRLGVLDGSAYKLASTVPLVRERTWPHLISPSVEPVNYRSLELQCTSGGGGQVTLEVSNDGGYTFGSPLPRSLGTTGRYMQRIRWHFLGSARDRVFRLRCSDDVAFNIHGATVDA